MNVASPLPLPSPTSDVPADLRPLTENHPGTYRLPDLGTMRTGFFREYPLKTNSIIRNESQQLLELRGAATVEDAVRAAIWLRNTRDEHDSGRRKWSEGGERAVLQAKDGSFWMSARLDQYIGEWGPFWPFPDGPGESRYRANIGRWTQVTVERPEVRAVVGHGYTAIITATGVPTRTVRNQQFTDGHANPYRVSPDVAANGHDLHAER